MWFFRVAKKQRRRIPPRIKEELYKRQDGRCSYCRIPFELPYFDIDHKLPVVIGGADRINNLQLLCGPCNRRKGALTDHEFRHIYELLPAWLTWLPQREKPQARFVEIERRKSVELRSVRERGRRKQFRSARKVIVVVGTLAAIGLIAFPSSVPEGIFEGVSEVSQAITNIVSSLKLLGRP